jgi:hypothetical protein
VHTGEGIAEFKPSARGLYYHDVSDPESNIKLMLMNTVRGNFEGYTCHKVKRGREVQLIQGMIANPQRGQAYCPYDEQVSCCLPILLSDNHHSTPPKIHPGPTQGNM